MSPGEAAITVRHPADLVHITLVDLVAADQIPALRYNGKNHMIMKFNAKTQKNSTQLRLVMSILNH